MDENLITEQHSGGVSNVTRSVNCSQARRERHLTLISTLKTLDSEYQINQLQIKFNEKKYLSMAERAEIAITLNITQNQVKIWFQVSYRFFQNWWFLRWYNRWFQNKRAKEKRRHAAEKAKNGRSGVSGSETLHVKPSTYEPSKYESSQSAPKMPRYEPSVPSPSFIAMPPGGHYSLGQQSRNEFKTEHRPCCSIA